MKTKYGDEPAVSGNTVHRNTDQIRNKLKNTESSGTRTYLVIQLSVARCQVSLPGRGVTWRIRYWGGGADGIYGIKVTGLDLHCYITLPFYFIHTPSNLLERCSCCGPV